jgi:hypothetical protein
MRPRGMEIGFSCENLKEIGQQKQLDVSAWIILRRFLEKYDATV